MQFFYCASGPEGDPVLVIRRLLPEDDIRDIKKNARLKTFARGHVFTGAHGLVFELDGDAGDMLEVDLKRFFCKKVSALQSARVVAPHKNKKSQRAE
jgi:hypothetical protein